MIYLDQNICMPTLSYHWHSKPSFLMDECLLNISRAGCGQLAKKLITLEPHGIFGSNASFFSIKIVQPLVCKPVLLRDPQVCTIITEWVRPSVRGQLLKMFRTLEPHDIFGSNCLVIYIKIVQPLVRKRPQLWSVFEVCNYLDEAKYQALSLPQ